MEKGYDINKDDTMEFKGFKDCKRCGGTGYIKAYGHVRGGQCFGCDGSGSIKVMEQNKEKARIREIKDLNETIVTIENSMINSKFKMPALQADRQKQIDQYRERLKQLEK